MLKTLWDIFIAFTRASNLGFGGGPAVVPLIQAEAVDRYKWMDDEEFANVLAVANALPGPIATKMAGYIGYRVAGWPGVIAAEIGTIMPTALVVILLGSVIVNYSDSPVLEAMLTAVRPVVVVLIAQTAFDMGKKAFPSKGTWVIALVTILVLYFLPIHPAFLIVGSMAFGYFAYGRPAEKK